MHTKPKLTISPNQNILDITEGIIAHQVNAQGVMGAGLAKQIKTKYPHNFFHYCQAYEQGQLILGTILLHKVTPKLYIANIVGQLYYGRKKGVQYTNSQALFIAFGRLYDYSKQLDLTPYIPYRIGCGLGGADWDEIQEFILLNCPNAVICKYEP